MASWTEGDWNQNDDYNDGLPYAGTNYPEDLDFSQVYIPYTFADPFPHWEMIPYIDSIDWSAVHMLFDVDSHNYGFPRPSQALPLPDTGSFKGAASLASITIPATVTFIDYYAFVGTALTSIKVAPDCYFFPEMLPVGCTVSYYTGQISQITWPNSDVNDTTFTTGDDVFNLVCRSNVQFKITDDDSVTYTRQIYRVEIDGFDTSAAATGLTAQIKFKTMTGTTYTKTITYDVVDPPTPDSTQSVDPPLEDI